MASHSPSERSWLGRFLKIVSVTPEERNRIVQEAISGRALQLNERRGSGSAPTFEDRQRAERDVLGPLTCGCLVLDRSLEIGADAASFGEGTIEIFVEPKRLTVRGKAGGCAANRASFCAGANGPSALIIRTVELPMEIDPAGISAKFIGRRIQMNLARACAKQPVRAAA